MELAMKLVTVLGLGAVDLWAAVPAGLALQLHPLATGLAAGTGALLGTLGAVSAGGAARTWLLRRRTGGEKKRRHKLVDRVWQRYGVVGLGLLAPVVTGAPLGAALGLALGAQAGRLLFWMSLGIVLWASGLTLAGTLGLAGIEGLGRLVGWRPS